MQKILGLDIGSYSIKSVEILNAFNSYRVVSFHEIVIPEIDGIDPSDIGVTSLQQLFTHNSIDADKIYTGIMGALASTRILTLKNVKKRNLGPVVQSELENQSPFKLEDVVIDHQLLDSRNSLSSVLTVMARKDDVGAYLSRMRELGIEPKIIDVDYLSFMNILPFIQTEQERLEFSEVDANTSKKILAPRKQKYRLFIDIGHQKTSVVLFHGQRLIAARTIRLAGRYFTEYLQKNLGITYGEAQRIKHAVSRIETSTEAKPKQNEEREFVIAKYLGLAVTELVRELVRTVHSFAAHEKAKPEEIFLSGGSSDIVGLKSFMQEAIGIPVYTVSFNTAKLSIDEDLMHKRNVMIQPLALGLRGINHKGQSQINLRKGELAVAGSHDEVVRQVSNVMLLVASLLICLFASYLLRWNLYGNQIKLLRTEYREIIKKTLKNEPNELSRIASKSDWTLKEYSTKAIKHIEGEIRDYDAAVKYFVNRQSVVPLRVLEDVSKAIPKKIEVDTPEGKKASVPLVVDILEFGFQGKSIVLEGETDSRTNAESITSVLKTVSSVQVTNSTSNAKTGSDKIIKFRVQMSLKEGN